MSPARCGRARAIGPPRRSRWSAAAPLSYGELDGLSGGLAVALREAGVTAIPTCLCGPAR